MLSAAHSRGRLGRILADKSWGNRASIVRRVCEEFEFLDARQQWQVAGCAKALSKLADRGCIVLPAPMNTYAAGAGPRLLSTPVPAARRFAIWFIVLMAGAVGFSAAAWRLASREAWMAWTETQRPAFLYRVRCRSRFLIRDRGSHLARPVWGRVRRRPEAREGR